MTPRVVQETFIRANRRNLKDLLSLLPKDKRALFCEELQKSARLSALRLFMCDHCSAWPPAVIESYVSSILRAFTAIRNMRHDIRRRMEPFEPLKEHARMSERKLRDVFRFSRFTYYDLDITTSSNKACFLGISGPVNQPIHKFSLPPSYARFTEKLGTEVCRRGIILSGNLVKKPFDGGEVWYCEVLDTQKWLQKRLYIGRCGYLYVAHAKLGACLNRLEQIAAERALEAMHEELLD